jgi:hypothetical protein
MPVTQWRMELGCPWVVAVISGAAINVRTKTKCSTTRRSVQECDNHCTNRAPFFPRLVGRYQWMQQNPKPGKLILTWNGRTIPKQSLPGVDSWLFRLLALGAANVCRFPLITSAARCSARNVESSRNYRQTPAEVPFFQGSVFPPKEPSLPHRRRTMQPTSLHLMFGPTPTARPRHPAQQSRPLGKTRLRLRSRKISCLFGSRKSTIRTRTTAGLIRSRAAMNANALTAARFCQELLHCVRTADSI